MRSYRMGRTSCEAGVSVRFRVVDRWLLYCGRGKQMVKICDDIQNGIYSGDEHVLGGV